MEKVCLCVSFSSLQWRLKLNAIPKHLELPVQYTAGITHCFISIKLTWKWACQQRAHEAITAVMDSRQSSLWSSRRMEISQMTVVITDWFPLFNLMHFFTVTSIFPLSYVLKGREDKRRHDATVTPTNLSSHSFLLTLFPIVFFFPLCVIPPSPHMFPRSVRVVIRVNE